MIPSCAEKQILYNTISPSYSLLNDNIMIPSFDEGTETRIPLHNSSFPQCRVQVVHGNQIFIPSTIYLLFLYGMK
jgi:hypothetical protein